MSNLTMIDGIMFSCQYLVLERDEPTFAEELMRSTGHTKKEFLAAQKKSGYESRKMNKVIREAFKNKTLWKRLKK